MKKISAVYKIVNEVTGDSYVGSSKDAMLRWTQHKRPSVWKKHPNSLLYKDMQKYGLDKFRFQILAPVMPEYLTQVEQEFIEMLQPTYNNYMAKGRDVERRRKTFREYYQSEKGKECYRKYQQSEKGKECRRKYATSDKGKEHIRKYRLRHRHRLCSYNGETLTFWTLYQRFRKTWVEHPYSEAKKYLIES